MDRVTFITSSGSVWLGLAVHFAVGLVSIVAGTIALSVAKGGRLHKQSGLAFTWAMVVLGLTAAGIGTYENRPGQVFGGLLAAYLTGDVVFGLEKGGREILVGVLILAVYLYGAVGLPERLAGYIILLLGGLASAALPVIHTMGRPLGERFAQLPGGFFFIWTLLTVGATGLVAFVLSVQAIWSLRQRRRASA